MMTAEQLKGSILQLAMQGKLVEQRVGEGTGEELYKEILVERKRLIKEGKIKKQKPLPDISDGETPFDIPETWKWTHLDASITLLSGADLTPEKYNSIEKGIVYITGASNIDNSKVIINRWTEYPKNIAHKGDLLLTCKGTVGKTAILELDEAHIARQIMAITPIMCYVDFVNYFIQFIVTDLKKKAKSMIPGIERASVLNAPFPLPPLAEQKRIVAKIEELMPFVEQYAATSTKLNTLNATFSEMMKKSILQEAVQGKLVPQDPNDEPASLLLKKIAEEKKRLIKEGKIKKQKPLPEITEDEIPFDIPESWEWVRLQDLTELITSGSRDWAQFYSNSGDIFLRMGNLSKNSFKLRLSKIQHVSLPAQVEGQRTSLQEGDLLFSITGEVGNLGLIPANFGRAYINQHTAMIRFCKAIRNLFIPFLMLTDYADKYYKGNQHGIKNSFRLDTIAIMPIPLPPLSEQKRIVAKIEKLMFFADDLERQHE